MWHTHEVLPGGGATAVKMPLLPCLVQQVWPLQHEVDLRSCFSIIIFLSRVPSKYLDTWSGEMRTSMCSDSEEMITNPLSMR